MNISDKNLEIISNSHNKTVSIAKKLGAMLVRGDVLALVGELGSGKTTFIKGIAGAFGVKDYTNINSPTFVIIREYELRVPIYHIDAYRIKNPLEIELAGFSEYLSQNGIAVIEWADRIEEILPSTYLRIELRHLGKNRRLIRFIPKGRRYKIVLKRFKSF
ncbi:MAG: tRNA (adenosine(37)-N6)-threonylcarbamoyltransferase complex ATPase subunit type 1 TsaE [Candidatus Omnitrophica bacterium]|nr:tRNA (adenosine(37)-N6)-threonylcarbamoyltransferase complex ATPase subunit type 1 TsaE [Candidatus Omnitrophota bacterium]